MIPSILLPRYFKWIGLALMLAGYTWAFTYTHDIDDVNYLPGLLIQSAVLLGLLLIAGARQRTEDEMIRHMRLTSLQWSVLAMICIRVLLKSLAFYHKDAALLPQLQVNGLLLIYLLLFYYQLYIRDAILKLFKRSAK